MKREHKRMNPNWQLWIFFWNGPIPLLRGFTVVVKTKKNLRNANRYFILVKKWQLIEQMSNCRFTIFAQRI